MDIIKLKDRIYTIRGKQVMLDRDLAELYEVSTSRLNEQVKRNIERFPAEYMFQITKEELEIWMSQIAISNSERKGMRKLPFVFTEQGIAMLSSVLRSEIAIKTSIKIMNAFVQMRKFLLNNASVFQRLERVEYKQIEHDKKFDEIFNEINKNNLPIQGIFYNGQIFDAYEFVSKLIKSAKKEIILIDNHIDESTLTLLKKSNTKITIYTKNITKQLNLDIKKYKEQYSNIEIKETTKFHDRFLIIDDEMYHLGASLKDLGKKIFAFSKMNKKLLNNYIE